MYLAEYNHDSTLIRNQDFQFFRGYRNTWPLSRDYFADKRLTAHARLSVKWRTLVKCHCSCVELDSERRIIQVLLKARSSRSSEYELAIGLHFARQRFTIASIFYGYDSVCSSWSKKFLENFPPRYLYKDLSSSLPIKYSMSQTFETNHVSFFLVKYNVL